MIYGLLGLGWFFSLLFGSAWWYERQLHQNCKKQNQTLQQELAKLKEIRSKCEIDKRRIENYYKTLIAKAEQKPKEVKVPVIVEKPIFIETEDCQKLGAMIDEAINLINHGD